jgi:cellulose synthase/poly-beta-1,6-N-acetylglucosamine synthase-like glycosyltransferase
MISIVITAYKEEKTVANALKYLADPVYSGYKEKMMIFQVSPDKATLSAGANYIKTLVNPNLVFHQIQDEQTGKPHALNKALKNIKSDILVLTDGDVSFEENALKVLIDDFEAKNFDIACGQVISQNPRSSFMGYISHMMTRAAHHKRNVELLGIFEGKGTRFVKKNKFFPLSGYILIFNKTKLDQALGEEFVFPTDCLVEDAYLSYVSFNYKLKLGYIPEAKVRVKFPNTFSDYFKQKKRSTGGFLQLWKYGIVKKETNSRSFWQEFSYFWFPIRFATSFKELIWSLSFFPIRFYLWIVMWWERKMLHKNFEKTWVRIESTK